MLHRLYMRTLALAASPRAPWWLAAVAFAESSFFPDSAGRPADPHGAGAARPRLALRRDLHGGERGGRRARLC